MLKTPAHDPGGKRSLPLPVGVQGSAVYGDPFDCYRYVAEYALRSFVEYEKLPTLMVVGMNPSTATHYQFDPTVAKVWRLAMRLGFVRLMMTNTFAYRATDQSRLMEVEDPIGIDNDSWLRGCASSTDMILMAYGTPNFRPLHARGPAVVQMLREAGHGHKLHVLKLSKSGVPCHPLYLPDSLVPVPWNG